MTLVTICGMTLIGAACGLLLLHALMLALLSSVATIAFLIIADWDWLLVPKLLATLCALQWSYLAGAAVRVLWDGSTRDEKDLSSDATERNLGGGRILIVEDEPLMAAYLCDEITA